jgi:sugar fermentation stimulation protein A
MAVLNKTAAAAAESMSETYAPVNDVPVGGIPEVHPRTLRHRETVNDLISHRWPGTPIEAELIARPNRFLALCRIGRQSVEAHVPDRGRCLDLLLPGQPLILVAAVARMGPLRRTRFTVLLARARTPPAPWVSLDPAGAPRLVAAALEQGLLSSLRPLRVRAREIAVGRARIDLLLGEAAPEPVPGDLLREAPSADLHRGVLCEVKSVGAACDGIARFPDAPTLRGARHLALLSRRARAGLRSAVVLCAQRGDVRAIAADAEIDPAFARALRRARASGVLVAGLACAAEPEGMRLIGEVPVL